LKVSGKKILTCVLQLQVREMDQHDRITPEIGKARLELFSVT
jgi:hypothetical protein